MSPMERRHLALCELADHSCLVDIVRELGTLALFIGTRPNLFFIFLKATRRCMARASVVASAHRNVRKMSFGRTTSTST